MWGQTLFSPGVLNDVVFLQLYIASLDDSQAPSTTITATLLGDPLDLVHTLTVLGHIIGSSSVVETSGTPGDQVVPMTVHKVGCKSRLSWDVTSAYTAPGILSSAFTSEWHPDF